MPHKAVTIRRRSAVGATVAWLAVWGFWLITTRSFHPTLALALIVTTSLIVAYAAAATLNQVWLIPQLLGHGRTVRYGLALLATMAVLNGLALAAIRVSYFRLKGPDPDPHGTLRHFLIDFFGMAVHVCAATIMAWVLGRFRSKQDLDGR